MERPSFTRHDTDAVPNEDEKKPYAVTSGADNSSGEFRDSKGSTEKKPFEDGTTEMPPYYHDTEAAIGEGEIGALETAEDIVTTVIHVDDDPTINPWTFRMFFIGQYSLHTRTGRTTC